MNLETIGLTTNEAQERLAKYGPNAIQEFKRHPCFEFLANFWSPIPWMLDITFILQLSLGKKNESIVTIQSTGISTIYCDSRVGLGINGVYAEMLNWLNKFDGKGKKGFKWGVILKLT